MLSSRNIQAGHSHGRQRSGTAGSADNVPSPQTAPPVTGPVRPPHLRSRSWLSPVDPKPRHAMTMPSSSEREAVGSFADKATEERAAEPGLLPKIHLHGHGHGHKARQSQDARAGSGSGHVVGSMDSQSQLPLQHLGLHLPVQVRRTHSHRHTRSELPRGSAGTDGMANDGLLHPGVAGLRGSNVITRMTSNLSSRNVGGEGKQHKPRHQHSASDFHRAINGAANAAIPSTGRPDLRRRATSDPRSPAFQRGMGVGAMAQFGVASYIDAVPHPVQERRKPLTEIEVLLYRADQAKKEADGNITEADVQKLTTQLAESNVELQEQLSEANHTAQNLMRRLDEAFEALVGTASSLMDTISSFQNLCLQSNTLVKNFENKTEALDGEMRATLEKHRAALFEDRGTKITELEQRGKKASKRAEEMSRRLENCRTIVRNFAEREQTKRRAWKGVLVGSLWGVALIFLGILLGLSLWVYKNHGEVIKHDAHEAVAMVLDGQIAEGAHRQLNDVLQDQLHEYTDGREERRVQILENVPEDVKAVLDDIANRHNATHGLDDKAESTKTQQYVEASSDGSLEGNKRLKKLFDKLEL